MERYTYGARQDAIALEEFSKTQPSRPLFSSAVNKQPTFADVKRRTQLQEEAIRDEAHLKRFRILNYTSEDSEVGQTERSLKTYYCFVCGAHTLVTDCDFFDLPQRTTDGAYVLQEANWFVRLYTIPGNKVHLRRQTGVEVQYRFLCKDCDNPLGYRCAPPEEENKYCYFFSGSLIQEQRKAAGLQCVGPAGTRF